MCAERAASWHASRVMRINCHLSHVARCTATLPLVVTLVQSELAQMQLWCDICEGPAGELGGKATHRAYCVLHSETQRRKDLEHAAEVRSPRPPAAPACQCSSDFPDVCCYTKADKSAFLDSCRSPAKETICAVQALDASVCANAERRVQGMATPAQQHAGSMRTEGS